MFQSRSDTHSVHKNKLRRQRRKIVGMILAALIVCLLAFGLWKVVISPNESAIQSEKETPEPTVLPNPTSISEAGNQSGEKLNPTDGKAISGSENAVAEESSRVRLSFVGDVIFAGNVENLLKQYGYDYPYSGVKEDLQKADWTVANLETPITEKGTVQTKDYVYRSSPKALTDFAGAGFDMVNLANNHVMDYGAEGLLDTFEHLDRAGIKRIGAGRDAEEAFKPIIVEKKGMRIAFLGFSHVVPEKSWKAGVRHPGVADTYSTVMPLEAIKNARSQADLVVVVNHWGLERKDKPESYETDLAHKFIDAGADLIIGGHAHVPQGFEQYKGKWIAYSLGNFIFTTNLDRNTLDSLIVEASCSKGRECDLHLVPIFTQWAKPVKMGDEEGKKLFERLSNVSFQAKISPEGQVLPSP